MVGSESDAINWAVLAREDSSSSVLYDEELALGIALRHLWMDRGGSSYSTALPVAQRSSCSFALGRSCMTQSAPD